MAPDDVIMLAQAVGNLQSDVDHLRKDWDTENKAFRIDWENDRRSVMKHLKDICDELKIMRIRHETQDRALGKITTLFHSGIFRGILAALAAGIGFGMIEQVLR